MTNFTIFCGSSHKELGNLICSRLDCSLGKIKIEKSENLEIRYFNLRFIICFSNLFCNKKHTHRL